VPHIYADVNFSLKGDEVMEITFSRNIKECTGSLKIRHEDWRDYAIHLLVAW
jgi:hypothetical protein